MAQATYDLRAKQQTSLTPRLQQSVKLLQMSALEFTQEVQQALSTNPFLDDGDDIEDEVSDDAYTQSEGGAEASGVSDTHLASDEGSGRDEQEHEIRAADDNATPSNEYDDHDSGDDTGYDQGDN